MDTGVNATLLMPEDPHACLAFYRDTLGCEGRNDVGSGGTRPITDGAAGQPGALVSGPPVHR